jgi:Ca-activated chloride channel family protein
MTFLWPRLLWLLALVPLLVLLYLWLLRRKKRTAMRYANLSILREAMAASSGWRRHVPPVFFLVALTLMIVAIARPAAIVTLPSQHEIIILAMDVSGSMRAADVKPSRLVGAQEAAKKFIDDLPHNTRVGIVSFAATASVVQPPTHNREDLIAAIDRFQLQRGTAIGSAIVVSLATIFPDAGIDLAALTYGRESQRDPHRAPRDRGAKGPDKDREKAATSAAAGRDKDFKPVPPGSYPSAAIVLLTDGQRTTGPDAMEAAKMAADRGVKVYTVGVGTKEGETIGFEGWSMRVKLDEETLKGIANVTRGEYFHAGNAPDLRKVYESLNAKLVFEKKETEVTALFAGAAAAIALLGAFLSMLWFNRIL